MPTLAVVVLFGALVLGTALSACAAPSLTSGGDPLPPTTNLGVPGALLETVPGVEAYPACGNEPIAHDGVTWYPFSPPNFEEFPQVLALAAGSGGLGGGMAVTAPVARTVPALPALPVVADPGPGDDVGTLRIYEGGFAHWRSDSGDIATWLTDEVIEYPWVC